MSKASQKIALSPSRDIPLDKLVPAQANVRRVKDGVSIEQLAADIARRGLLQSLHVRPLREADDAETGMFAVLAGGRRLEALQLLVKQKRLIKTAPVPCVVRETATDILPEDDSLAENVQRAPLHPLDQFRAFKALRDKGQSEEAIAAAFFVSAGIVKQRLRLAAVSEKLLDIFAADGMSLEELMAFTVSNDHKRQEQVWEAIGKSRAHGPYAIRRMLTERAVRASDRRALFVGIDAYEKAGGTILRDLFAEDDGGWLEDVALLDRLVADRLKSEAEKIVGEGWKWVEAAVNLPYGHNYRLREIEGTPSALTAEEQASIEALKAEQAELEAGLEGADEIPEEVDARLGEIEELLEAFAARPMIYDPADVARAGAFVSIGANGALDVDRGYVRPEDESGEAAESEEDGGEAGERSAPDSEERPTAASLSTDSEAEEDDEDTIKPLPDRLLGELTAARTLALQDAVAAHPHAAMTALLHKLCLDTFASVASTSCVQVFVRPVSFFAQPRDLKASAAARAIEERHDGWKACLPRDDDALWDWLTALDEPCRAALLAHCLSFGINALHEKVDRHGAGLSGSGLRRRLAQADLLARAVGLDMVEAGWQPTIDNYLGRVTKPRILEAVREARGEQAVQLIDHLKKAEMAKEAERLLEGTGWLPEPLRPATLVDDEGSADDSPADAGGSDQDDALPAFLAADDEAGLPDDIAAE